MANIIDASYFEKGILYIPNNKDVNVSPEGSPTNQSDLDFFITQYERELLLNALGIVLYDELQIALTDIDNSEQKWQDLVNGKTYTNSQGVAKRWDGLKGFNNQSVIAFYIYVEYLRNYNETFSTAGVVKNDSKNATNDNGTTKYIAARLKFIELYQSQNEVQPRTYINGLGTTGIDWFESEKATVSLYEYLLDSNNEDETAFPNLRFKFYHVGNSLGI